MPEWHPSLPAVRARNLPVVSTEVPTGDDPNAVFVGMDRRRRPDLLAPGVLDALLARGLWPGRVVLPTELVVRASTGSSVVTRLRWSQGTVTIPDMSASVAIKIHK